MQKIVLLEKISVNLIWANRLVFSNLPTLVGIALRGLRGRASRKEDYHIVRVRLVQDGTRPLLQKVGVQIVGAQLAGPALHLLPLAAHLIQGRLCARNLALQVRQRHKTAITMHRVIGEIGHDGHANHRPDNLSDSAAKGGAEGTDRRHGRMESQAESGGQ